MYCGVTEEIQSGRGLVQLCREESSEPDGRKCSLSGFIV